mgnify:CR=1 FL=1
MVAALVFVAVGQTPAQAPQPPELECGAAVLIDPGTRQFLFEHNADERRFPASLTKMMTALLVAEAGNLHRTVTISERAAAVGETSMNLTEGEQLKLEHILMGALLPSANDAASACAEAVSGDRKSVV